MQKEWWGGADKIACKSLSCQQKRCFMVNTGCFYFGLKPFHQITFVISIISKNQQLKQLKTICWPVCFTVLFVFISNRSVPLPFRLYSAWTVPFLLKNGLNSRRKVFETFNDRSNHLMTLLFVNCSIHFWLLLFGSFTVPFHSFESETKNRPCVFYGPLSTVFPSTDFEHSLANIFTRCNKSTFNAIKAFKLWCNSRQEKEGVALDESRVITLLKKITMRVQARYLKMGVCAAT